MLSSNPRLISSIAILTLALSTSAQASESIRLSTVAEQNGFTYQWIPTEAGAMLSRPGVRIVIRAGRLFYEVNAATPIADSAPRFDGRDLVISQKLASHLRDISRHYPYPSVNGPVGAMPGDAPVPALAVPRTDTLTIHAKQIPGKEALAFAGTGPAGVAVTITLTGEMSTDLPVTVLSRTTIVTTSDGTFFAEVPYGQDTHPQTILAATVTTLSGGSSAETRVVIGKPSPQIKSSGLDEFPKK